MSCLANFRQDINSVLDAGKIVSAYISVHFTVVPLLAFSIIISSDCYHRELSYTQSWQIFGSQSGHCEHICIIKHSYLSQLCFLASVLALALSSLLLASSAPFLVFCPLLRNPFMAHFVKYPFEY